MPEALPQHIRTTRPPQARSMAKDLVYAKYVDDDGAHTSPQLWADYAECLYWLGEDPAPAAVKALAARGRRLDRLTYAVTHLR